jgi:hypothetical protein
MRTTKPNKITFFIVFPFLGAGSSQIDKQGAQGVEKMKNMH